MVDYPESSCEAVTGPDQKEENNGFKEVFITMTDMVSDHDIETPICDYSYKKSNDENEVDCPEFNVEAVAGPDKEASHF